MALDPRTTGAYTDFAALTRLKAAARTDRKAASGTVARQFETLFTQMMLKSMRGATTSSGLFDSQQSKSYRELADQQLAVTLSTRGKGLGIAKVIERQLDGRSATADASGHASNGLNALPGRPLAAIPVAGNAVAETGSSTLLDGADTLRRGLHPAVHAAYTAIDAASNGALRRVREQLPASAGDFVRTMLPHAEAAAKQLGVSVRAVLAHAALETGWGQHMPRVAGGASSNNLFGIKAGSSWQGARAKVATTEYENGAAVRRVDNFRAYTSPAGAFSDYADLLAGNPRYSSALGHGDDVSGFAKALQRAGYATDPAYASKLAHIANSSPMRDALAALKNPPALPSF
ncbi:MAG: flagellar assembly peptidoglycan hydrolase FlgJ [Dokdonella sp.]